MRRIAMMLMTAALAPAAALAQDAQAPAPPRAVEVPPAKAIKSGDVVVDRDGLAVGQVKTLSESDRGAMVVVEIDGMLVGVPQAVLSLDGERVISRQTKAQMLAAAGAPG